MITAPDSEKRDLKARVIMTTTIRSICDGWPGGRQGLAPVDEVQVANPMIEVLIDRH